MTNRISVYFKEENLTDLGHYKRLTTSCRCLSEISGHWIDFLQIEAAFRKTNYTTFSYLLIPMYGQDMSEISCFTVRSAKSRKFTNVCTVGGRFVPPPCPPTPPPPSNLHFQTWQFYLFLGALSSGVYGFFRACPYQKLKKKVEGSIVTSLKTTEWKQIRKHDLYTVDDRLVTYYFPFLSKVFCLICFQHMEGLN